MFQQNSTAFPSATAVLKSSRWKYLFCVGCTHLGVWAQCRLAVWGAMQVGCMERNVSWVYGAQCRVPKAAPRFPPPPPTALSTWSALPYLVCFCILCCSYFSWGIFLVALQLQDMHLGHVVLVKDMYMGQGSPQLKVQLADSYDGQHMRYSSLSSRAHLKWSRKEQILPVNYYHLSNTIAK